MSNQNLKENGGSFAKLLMQLSERLEKNEELEESFAEKLTSMLKENKSYLEELQQQDKKGIMRQLLNLEGDLFMTKASLNSARSRGVISGDLKASLESGTTFEDVTASQEEKRNIIENYITNLGNIDSVVYKFQSAAEFYNTAVEEKLIKRKSYNSDITFNIDVKVLPEHREKETIFKSLRYDFLTKNANTGEAVFHRSDDEYIEENKIGVKTVVSFNRNTRKLNVVLKAVRNRGTEDEKYAPDISILIDAKATITNLIEEVNKQYLIKSSILKDDFENEVELVQNLYLAPLKSLLASMGDAQTTERAIDMFSPIYEMQTALSKFEVRISKKHNTSPLFKAWLSILKDNAQAGVGKNEKLHRISKSQIVERYFGGDTTIYDLIISEGTPSQSPTARRNWVIRVDFGTIDKPNKIDFLITTYGKSRKEIWVPIEKDYITPIAFANEFDRSHNVNKAKFIKGMSKQSQGVNIVSGASSNKQFDTSDFE